MSLLSLEILQFRNLQHVRIEPDAGLNIISGVNAAGKTSLLESIFYLSYGRSFRNSQARDLIMYDKDFFRLLSKTSDGHHDYQIGIQKSIKDQIIRINQQTVTRVTELSALLPVIALHPDSHHLITAGPEYRRQFIDWGVFHVEHAFIKSWKDFRRALSQRNAALRNNESDRVCNLWNQVLVENAEFIQKSRCQYLEELNEVLKRISGLFFPDNKITLEYRRGWTEDQDYLFQLQQTLVRDKEKGFTQSGPHRADIKIKLDNKSAQTSISRGQQKKLVAMLKLAQLEMFIQSSDKTCVLIYDDLPAELDSENRRIIMDMLASMKVQVFVSAIENSQLEYSSWNSGKMFHVEHGEVSTTSL
ncbi:MAG: DNA replication/repair protein RecF [Gammaproteobacteria bacterium]|nr:DNA replication/repair protein RecF [Gammaproteobacteria bacterium]